MVRPGDAFLVPTGTGYAFGAVLHVDRHRSQAVVRFQAMDYGRAQLDLVEQWKAVLDRVGTEVRP